MSAPAPRGTVQRCYANARGEIVAVIRWVRGDGPVQVVGAFRDGQAVTIRNGEVVPV